MKKKGAVTGLLFVVLLAFVFQTEIGGFLGSVRDKAKEAASADTAALAEKENLPKLNEGDAEAPPVPNGTAAKTTEDTAATSSAVTYKEVSLYYVDTDSSQMKVEKRSVINSVGVARATMEELLTGPTETSLKSYIPADTEILGINIDSNGLCTVDFSKEIQNAKLNSAEERYVLESIVGTLSQFDSVKSVQIKVNGEIVQSLTGHWDISKPLTPTNM